MRCHRQGSALLLTLVLGSVLLLGLAALVGVALNEHRNSEHAVLNSAAFHLAEAGVDRSTQTILDDAFTATTSAWTTKDSATYARTFAADTASIAGRTGGYTVVVRKTANIAPGTDRYTVSAKGWVANAGASVRGERAIEVIFDRQLNAGGNGKGGGCIALNQFVASSTIASSLSASQVGPTFDSYKSGNNTAPSAQNRDNRTLVGTLSAANNALNLGNGSYFASVATGSSPATPAPTVTTATNASPPYNSLAKLDDLNTAALALVDYNPALVRHDLDLTIDSVVPPDAPAKDGWYQALPKDGQSNSQWKLNGKLADFDPKKNAVATNITVNGSTVSIGATNADKHYLATTSLDNIATLNISGEVILVCLGPINATNGLAVNYKTPDAKLTIYAANNISGVIKTTQQLSTGTAVANYESKRLVIAMLPGNSSLDMASLEPAAINGHVAAAVKAPTAGGTIIMNFGDKDTFVGQINAPYSFAQLSATGQKGKLSDYCGSLLAKNIQITGSNGFAFHYDEDANGSGSGNKTPSITRVSWRQILATDTVFQ